MILSFYKQTGEFSKEAVLYLLLGTEINQKSIMKKSIQFKFHFAASYARNEAVAYNKFRLKVS